MDGFLGSWKLDAARNEGPSTEAIRAMGIPEEYVDMFAKAVYTLAIEKEGDNQFKYSFTMEGAPQVHVAGPFKLGEMFEFYDPFCKRTEQITISMEGDKTKEVTVIKETPKITWTTYRYLQAGEFSKRGNRVQSFTRTDETGMPCSIVFPDLTRQTPS